MSFTTIKTINEYKITDTLISKQKRNNNDVIDCVKTAHKMAAFKNSNLVNFKFHFEN